MKKPDADEWPDPTLTEWDITLPDWQPIDFGDWPDLDDWPATTETL